MSGATHAERTVAQRRLKPYPARKDSGIEWLGKIPVDWHLRRLKDCVQRLESGGTPESDNVNYWTDDESGTPWVAISDMTRSFRVRDTAKRLTERGLRSKRLPVLPAGTLLYSMYASLGKVALLEIDAVVNQAILGLVTRSDVASRDFLRWWLEFMQGHIQMLSSSNTQDNLNADKVRTMPVLVPAPDTQSAVSAFLDRETTRIDALMAKKERLIELLQEQRTALITRAVTKGLDPTVPMKDSGVEWIGEIPAHWEVSRLSTICEFEPGKAHEPFIDDEGEFVCVNSRFVSTDGRTRKFCSKNLSPAKRNDVVMVMSDLPNGRALAKAFFVTEDSRYAVNQRVCILSARNVNPKLLFYALNRSPFFLRYDDGVNQTHLPNAAFTKCPVLLPSQPEQMEIVRRLDDVTARIDALSEKVSEAIATLREFRTALISAAVTGKIDVRQEVA